MTETVCAFCGRVFVSKHKGKQKPMKFCSDGCRKTKHSLASKLGEAMLDEVLPKLRAQIELSRQY